MPIVTACRSPIIPAGGPSRRTVPEAGAGAGVAASPALSGVCSTLSGTASKVAGTGAVDTHRRTVGDIDVTTLPDGSTARRQTPDTVASERMLLAGSYLPFPACGYVVADGDAWLREPAEWQYG